MNQTILEPKLLIDDHAGIYVIQEFCQRYLPYIVNRDELQEDIDICLAGPDHDEYMEAWDNLIDNVKLTNDNGQMFSIGNLPESGDLWAIPEGYEFPED